MVPGRQESNPQSAPLQYINSEAPRADLGNDLVTHFRELIPRRLKDFLKS